MQCFVSIPGAQLVGFPTTSGGKKSNHLVGSSASGQKYDHLVGNQTTLCSKNKISKLKRGGLGPAKSIVLIERSGSCQATIRYELGFLKTKIKPACVKNLCFCEEVEGFPTTKTGKKKVKACFQKQFPTKHG